jgi:hypothetical protein
VRFDWFDPSRSQAASVLCTPMSHRSPRAPFTRVLVHPPGFPSMSRLANADCPLS